MLGLMAQEGLGVEAGSAFTGPFLDMETSPGPHLLAAGHGQDPAWPDSLQCLASSRVHLCTLCKILFQQEPHPAYLGRFRTLHLQVVSDSPAASPARFLLGQLQRIPSPAPSEGPLKPTPAACVSVHVRVPWWQLVPPPAVLPAPSMKVLSEVLLTGL